jgi:regulatory protein
MINSKKLTPEQALQKMRRYCAYQERSHQGVRERLKTMGIYRAATDEIIARLIEDDFLNEERFAKAYAGGKFRVKAWGRRKIRQQLQLKKISDYCIRKALEEIPEEDYLHTLAKLAEKKYHSLKGEQYLARKLKTRQYLLQKGYEADYISEVLAQMAGK